MTRKSYRLVTVEVCRRVPRVRAGYTRGGQRVRRALVDVFFFKTVPYPSHTRVRRGYTGTTGTGYSGTRVGESGTGRVGGSNVITVSETVITSGTRVRAGRRRVHGYGYNGFFPKKKLTDPSQTHTRVPVYPPIPGHRYGYRGY
jgi:hypothetical protein